MNMLMNKVRPFCAGLVIFALLLVCGCTAIDGADNSSAVNTSDTVMSDADSSAATDPDSQPQKPTQSPTTSATRSNKVSSKPAVTSESEIVFTASVDKLISVKQEDYYCLSTLTAAQKKAYGAIKEAAATRTVGFVNLGSISEKEAKLVYAAVKNDYPEYFWMPNSFLIKPSTKNNMYLAMESADNKDCGYPVSSNERTEMARSLDSILKEICNDLEKLIAGGGCTENDLAAYVYNYLCSNTTYHSKAASDSDSYPMAFTSYGALVEGMAVCEGYARAASLIFNIIGIPNTLVAGHCDGEGHMWNLVNIGKGWYHTDITWADEEFAAPYPFFYNLSDAMICRDRTISPNITADFLNIDQSFNFALPKAPSCGPSLPVDNYILVDVANDPDGQIADFIINSIAAKPKRGEYYLDVMAKDGTNTDAAIALQDNINFKKLTAKINRAAFSYGLIITNYSVSSCRNGGIRFYYTLP